MDGTVNTAGATLPKAERISGHNAVSALVKAGHWGAVPGLKYCWKADNGLEFSRLMVSVPKKFFKRAVKRNLLKRRLREGYRTRKALLAPGTDLMIVYNSKEIADSATLHAAVEAILLNVSAQIHKDDARRDR